jgi:hypothetical protein
MPSDNQTAPVSKKMLWTGRIMSALAVLFLLMDGVMKLFNPAPVVEGMTKLGYPLSLTAVIGIILLICVVLFAIPRTSILGAILLTGYLGGAVASQLRVGFVQQRLVSDLYGCADLGRALRARRPAAGTHSAAK